MKTMISEPNLIHYACIAKGTTILAEFNSRDADLEIIALKCLDKTPSYHTMFSQTVRNRTYLFLIDDPFSYFAMFDENLAKNEGLAFLRSVKDSFNDNAAWESSSGKRRLESLTSHCFQGEFSPVFRQLLVSDKEMEGLGSPTSGGSVPSGKPLLGDGGVNCMKKKKRFLLRNCVHGVGGNGKDEMGRKGLEVSDETAIRLNREFSVVMHKDGLYSGDIARQNAKKVWRKHVWVVLSMDLIICIIFFVVWLCICRGFKCLDV